MIIFHIEVIINVKKYYEIINDLYNKSLFIEIIIRNDKIK